MKQLQTALAGYFGTAATPIKIPRVDYPAATIDADVAVTGTYRNGKYFRANDRWAKVTTIKMINRPVRISYALGNRGETNAFYVGSVDTNPKLTRTRATRCALLWLIDGVRIEA